ncbi:uncharacterized protein LOC100049343 precursor [Oryzias latipes]|uniref:Histidine rich glycoprotein n=1 Tax=Oryzias latipes TaxID=8090 RepID=Q9W7C7_ORYLA|nr:uncharacterized protein LOC100049343 precursor [Oryzias latipes]AAD38922.1 unknown [Oryzias latipes]
MAAGFLISRFLLIFVLSELKYSSVFPSVGSWGSFQVTFDPGFHHHHKPTNPLMNYWLKLKELPNLWHHTRNKPLCCDGDSKVPRHPVKPPVPICEPTNQGPDCPVKHGPTHPEPKWPIVSHGPSHHHLHWPFFRVLHGLLCHQHPCPHAHSHAYDDDRCSAHQHPRHCGKHKHHHGPVFYHPHHGPGHHHHHHHHNHQQQVKVPPHGCEPHSKLCS